GLKLPDDTELAIEAEMDKALATVCSKSLGKAHRITDAAGRYIEFCKSTIALGTSLAGMKIVLDCAHGATYHVAPRVLEELGADVVTIGDEPDGLNINLNCGATDTAQLCREVIAREAHCGIALDGDGDRLIMVDAHGQTVDGDEITFIIARERQKRSALKGAVIGTQMSNLGLEHAVRTLGLDFKRAKVGDRYVMEMLLADGGTLGGETSGHIICLDLTTTGDGIISALQVLDAMNRTGHPLHTLKAGMSKYPQHLVNVRMERMVDVTSLRTVRDAVRQVESELADGGRVLLRPSGTEPVVRVMVEGRDDAQVRRLANDLAAAVQGALTSAA
ncbi:MAG: phosphoglucosamine mutase, partial [Phycisphaerales bacterium]|nr:phosphoglucosamine mutase [Phycisphaerales bacterium]